MSSERTNKKRLDDIEKQLDGVKEDLSEVKKEVTNDIRHKLDKLVDNDEKLFAEVLEGAKANVKVLEVVNKIDKSLSKMKAPGY